MKNQQHIVKICLITLCFFIIGCSANTLDPIKQFAHQHCMGANQVISSSKADQRCQWAETPLERAKRFQKDPDQLARAIDNLIIYLDKHPDSEEAKELLSELKQAQMETMVLGIDTAIQKRDAYQIWKLAKDFQYLERRLRPHSSIDPNLVYYINNSEIVAKAIEHTEKRFGGSRKGPLTPIYGSSAPYSQTGTYSDFKSASSFFQVFNLLAVGASCAVSGNEDICEKGAELHQNIEELRNKGAQYHCIYHGNAEACQDSSFPYE